jgi:hypothetical protein
MARQAKLTARTGLNIYFAAPHSLGSVAATNIRMGCCASIWPRALIYRRLLRRAWMKLRICWILGHGKRRDRNFL